MDVDVARWAREIVAQRALVVILIVLAVHGAIAVHVVPSSWTDDQVGTWVGHLVDSIGAVAAIWWARSAVTPADVNLGPRSANGLPLVEQLATDQHSSS